MKSKIDYIYASSFIEILESLEIACKEAGGNIDIMDLKNMTAIELLSHLCPNDIRFIKLKKLSKKKIIKRIIDGKYDDIDDINDDDVDGNE